MGKIFKRMLGWGPVIAGFAVGLLVGVLIRFPAGWSLPDSSANIVGSAIGAILSIGGAFVALRMQLSASEMKDRNFQLEGMRQLADTVVPLSLKVRRYFVDYAKSESIARADLATELHDECIATIKRAKSFEQYRTWLGLSGMRRLDLMLDHLEIVSLQAAQIKDCNRSDKNELEAIEERFAECYATLAKEIADLAKDDGYVDFMLGRNGFSAVF